MNDILFTKPRICPQELYGKPRMGRAGRAKSHFYSDVCAGALALSAMIGYTTPAWSQATEGAGGVTPRLGNEIIVTANKREEDINTVGVTVQAITSSDIEERQISSLSDVAAAVPGLTFSISPTNTPFLTLRGIGFNEESLGVYPAVSVYVDEVPLTFPVMAAHAAFDLERIEVLKGPQGTLFGQNSTGGAINYIAAKPTDYLDAGASLSYGRFNTVEGSVHLSGPVGNKLRARVALTGRNSDGWQYSQSRPDDRNGATSFVAGRAIVDFESDDALQLSLMLTGWTDSSEPQAQQLVAVGPNSPNFTSDAMENAQFTTLGSRVAEWSINPSRDSDFYQVSFRAGLEIANDITLTSLTAYSDYNQDNVIDGDGSLMRAIDVYVNDGSLSSFTQELRLSNGGIAPVRWIVGANYEKSKTSERFEFDYFDASSHNPNNFFINKSGVRLRQDIENIAFFANAEFDAVDRITLRAGGRYTTSRNKARECGYAPGDGNVAILFNRLGNLLGQIPFDPIGPSDCYTLNYEFVPGEEFRDKLKEDNISWKVGVDFKPSEKLLVYANISRGFKAGSYPVVAASRFVQYEPVVQEKVTSYELGLKSSLFEKAIQLNAATFYSDYRNKQLRGKIGDPLFRILNALVNVPRSSIFGIEGDVSIRPVEGLTIGGQVTYLNTKIQKYKGINIVGTTDYDFSGSPLPFAAKFSYGFNADYRIRTGSGGMPFIGLSLTGRSSIDAQPGGYRIQPLDRPFSRSLLRYPNHIPGYATVDARIGYESPDRDWKVMIWGKNVLNERYWINTASGNESTALFSGMPATYGVTLSFNID